jgi:hypothetical protein
MSLPAALCVFNSCSANLEAAAATVSSATHLDHLNVGHTELCCIGIQHGCHDSIQGVAVQDSASIPQLICLHATKTASQVEVYYTILLKYY